MIDVEVDIFDQVANAVCDRFPDAYVSSRHVAAPPQFPAVSVVEKDNLPVASAMDSSGREKASSLTYVVNVYSNSEANAKEECKQIVDIVNDTMTRLNMSRTMCSVVDNVSDPTIYRMLARFAGVVGEDHVMYRR